MHATEAMRLPGALVRRRREVIDAGRLGRVAVASLHAELVCSPKPGLVTPFDTGSHDDMDAATFLRSLFALRGFFVAIAHAGAHGSQFAELRQLGIDAESAMHRATGGVNTHRGGIFSLGLLVAAAAALRCRAGAVTAEDACREVRDRWGDDLLAAGVETTSHGQRAAQRYGVGGARLEAAHGFPTIGAIALPALRAALASGASGNDALVQTLMALIANTDDTNLLHRGGREGLACAQRLAREFTAAGGVAVSGWRDRLAHVCDEFVARRLSPGGSADLLACTWFLLRVERLPR